MHCVPMVWVNDFQLRFQLRFGNRFQLQLSDSYVGQVGSRFQFGRRQELRWTGR